MEAGDLIYREDVEADRQDELGLLVRDFNTPGLEEKEEEADGEAGQGRRPGGQEPEEQALAQIMGQVEIVWSQFGRCDRSPRIC